MLKCHTNPVNYTRFEVDGTSAVGNKFPTSCITRATFDLDSVHTPLLNQPHAITRSFDGRETLRARHTENGRTHASEAVSTFATGLHMNVYRDAR